MSILEAKQLDLICMEGNMDELTVKEYLTQGAMLAEYGKYPEAITYYDKAEQENPMNFEIYLAKGIAYANMNQFDVAKAQFEKVLKINRTLGEVYFHLGNIAVLQEDSVLAFENYNKAIVNGYNEAQLFHCIGLLHAEKGEDELAINNYTKAIKLDPLRPDIRICKAELLIESNRIPEALQVLDDAILTNPNYFEGHHLKFVVLLRQHQLDKAEETLTNALNLFPEDSQFMMDKVALLVDQNKTDEALSLLNELEESPENNSKMRQISMARAQIFSAKADIQAAIKELEKANVLVNQEGEFDTEIVFLLANCYMTAGKYDKLLKYSHQIIEKSDVLSYKQIAQYYIPMALKMLGRMEEAQPLYQEAIKEFRNQALVEPTNMDVYILRAMCLRDLEQFNEALKLIDYVITLQPNAIEPRTLRITLLESLGRIAEGQEETVLVNTIFSK